MYDTRNKFIAFHAGFSDVTHVLAEWGTIFVLCGDGKLFRLSEKDFRTKLDMLFKKNLYEIAINLAKTQSSRAGEANEHLVEIYKVYAGHLYQKGNYNDAINQYIKTIGVLEPSYVIRKFLDSQRIHNLTAYLKALHDHELADKHHTTLLLNCYTKLKDDRMMDEFIMADRHLNFDLETAIRVCRQAGYFQHALFLARKHEQHDWYLKIQLEDQKNHGDALEYTGTLPFAEAERHLKVPPPPYHLAAGHLTPIAQGVRKGAGERAPRAHHRPADAVVHGICAPRCGSGGLGALGSAPGAARGLHPHLR